MEKGIKILSVSAVVIAILALILAVISAISLALTLSSISIQSFRAQSSRDGVSLLAVLELENEGVLAASIDSVKITVTDSHGDKIGDGLTGGVEVSPGSRATLSIPINMRFEELEEETIENLLYNDQVLKAFVIFEAAVKPFIKLIADARLDIEWGAPLHDLKIGSPTVSPFNNTHFLVEMPVSFQNRNPYVDIDAIVDVSILDADGSRIGYGTLHVKAGPKSSYSDNVRIVMRLPPLVEELLFSDRLLSYTAVIEITPSAGPRTTVSREITYQWGAPLKGFKLGEPVVKPYNETHLAFSIPVSFSNNNEHISLDGTLRFDLYDAVTGELVGVGELGLSVASKSDFSGRAAGFLKMLASPEELLLKGSRLEYRLVIDGVVRSVHFSLERVFSHELRPLIRSIAIGDPLIMPHNATHALVTIPVSIDGGSPDLTLRGKIYAEFYDAAGRKIGRSEDYMLELPPRASLRFELTGFISNAAIMEGVIKARIVADTQYGYVSKEVEIRV